LKTTLNHITTIQTGLFAKPVSKGEIVYLQVKHFDENGQLNSVLHPDLLPDNSTQRHLLKSGDVLFAAKGTKNFAALYENKNLPAVASTSFFVIRLQETFQNKLMPQFLVWFLSHPTTQSHLKGEAQATNIASISKAVLSNLEISIPPLTTQTSILKIARLLIEEKKLAQEIDALRDKQIQQQIINAIK